MKLAQVQNAVIDKIFFVTIIFLLAVTAGCAASGSKSAGQQDSSEASQVAVQPPVEIPANATCGKCGMYPAQYLRWHSQIIFMDGTMTPFDGCKCMFNFLFAMDKFDQKHSREEVAVAWVKDFDNGAWINAVDANFVVGSNMMGPMGKELIPFSEQAAAMKFQQEQGGILMKYAEITPDVLKSLGMGGMKMEGGLKHMKM